MKIILLTSIFPPEPIVSAQTAFSMARELSSSGHQVIVITSFPSRPAGKLYPGYKMRLYQKKHDPSGFELVRCFSMPSPKSTLLSRFGENITFGLSAALYLLFLPGVDVLYVNTWFIFAAGLMSIVARMRKIPYVIRVTDLYPESLVSQKRLSPDRWVHKLMRQIDTWIADGASHVAVLTSYFAKTYIEDRGIPASKVSTIPDWVDEDISDPSHEKPDPIRKQFGIAEDAFLAVYGGNIGVAAGVDAFIKAGAALQDVHILIAGAGSELEANRTLASQVAPNRVSFFSPWPKEQTMAVYQAADVLVLTTHEKQSVASIPSKLIRYMLSGRAVIAAGLPGTELEKMVKESQCGWVIPPDDPDALVQSIIEARNLGREKLNDLGLAGRNYALKTFSTVSNLPRIVSLLEEAASRNQPGRMRLMRGVK